MLTCWTAVRCNEAPVGLSAALPSYVSCLLGKLFFLCYFSLEKVAGPGTNL